MPRPPTERLQQAVDAEVASYREIGHPISTSEAEDRVRWRWCGARIADWGITREELSWLELIELPCSICGSPATCSPWAEFDRRVSRRCSTCARTIEKENARRHSAEYRQSRRQEKQPQACAHCGATFTPKRSTAQFCSTRCRVAAHRAAAKG